MSEKKINITKISKERFNNISFIFRENFSVSLEKFNDKKILGYLTKYQSFYFSVWQIKTQFADSQFHA